MIGRPDLAADATLRTLDGRQRRHDEIDVAIAAWSTTVDQVHGAEALQGAGVPAAPVMPNWQIFSDNHLNDRGFFVPIRHPEAGTHAFPAFPWLLEKTPAVIERHAPLFAQHNQEVFTGILGLDEAAIAALHASAVTSDVPSFAGGPTL